MRRQGVFLVTGVLCVAGGESKIAERGRANRLSLIERIDLADARYDETRFRPVCKDGRLVNAITMEQRTELSLTPPVPSEIAFAVSVPAEPVFRFSTGVESLGEEELQFPNSLAVYVDVDGRRNLVLSELFRRRAVNRWRDQDVDLRPWAGKPVTLTLTSRFADVGVTSQPR